MGLPQRAFYPVHEAAIRWGCTVSDIAGWAAMGTLKVVTGIPPVHCGDQRVAGLVNIDPTDILPMFRRCGTGPQQARLLRIQLAETESWLYITAPESGVVVSIGDLMLLGRDVLQFEVANDLFGRVAGGAGLGSDGDYDWAAMYVEIVRRVFEEGLPNSQAEWVAVAQYHQSFGRHALRQHLSAQGGRGQRLKPRVQRGEDCFAGSGHGVRFDV